MQEVKSLIAQYPGLASLSAPFIHRSYLIIDDCWTLDSHTSIQQRKPNKFFAGYPWEDWIDAQTVLFVGNTFILTQFPLTQPTSQHFQSCIPLEMNHNKSQLADMHHTGVKGLNSTSCKYGQALNFTIVQTLAKALFGCGVFCCCWWFSYSCTHYQSTTTRTWKSYNEQHFSNKAGKGDVQVQWLNFH